MDLSTVRDILLERFNQLTTIGVLISDNESYNPQARTPYARFTFTPVETSIETIGSKPWQRLQGFATIQLFEPKGVGATSLFANADEVLSHFPSASHLGTELDFVHIEKSFGSSTIETAPAYTQLNVIVRWYAFKRDA